MKYLKIANSREFILKFFVIHISLDKCQAKKHSTIGKILRTIQLLYLEVVSKVILPHIKITFLTMFFNLLLVFSEIHTYNFFDFFRIVLEC